MYFKKIILIAPLAVLLFSCSKEENSTLTENPNNTSVELRATTYDFEAFKDFNNDGSPQYSSSSSGSDYLQWTDGIANSGLTTAYCQNVSASADLPEGWQSYKANKPTSSFPYCSFEVNCYKPRVAGQCLPFPKVKVYINTVIEKITTLKSFVNVNVPPLHMDYGYPDKPAPVSDGIRRFNSSFDIYFDKAGQVKDRYCAFMVWINWEGSWGPGGINLLGKNSDGTWKTVTIDGQPYYVVGQKDYLAYDYTINYCRKNRSELPGNINVLNIIKHAMANKYMSDKGFSLAGAKLADYNFGFEIFLAKGAENQVFKLTKFSRNFAKTN
jgi:hypothetical protein